MKRQLLITVVFTFVASLFIAEAGNGQQRRRGGTPSTYTPATEQTSPSNVRFRSDADLQSMARRSLERDEGFSSEARNVNIRVRNGRASLQGFVNSNEESEALQRKVMAIDGVRSVNNKISIQE